MNEDQFASFANKLRAAWDADPQVWPTLCSVMDDMNLSARWVHIRRTDEHKFILEQYDNQENARKATSEGKRAPGFIAEATILIRDSATGKMKVA